MTKNENQGPVDQDGRPLIEKIGTVELDLTEVNPVVFKGRLYRFEYIRGNETTTPYYGNELGHAYSRFVDCETGEAQEVSITPAVTARYKTVYDGFFEKLATFARQHNAGLLQLNVDERVVPQLAHLFESGAYSV